MSCELMLIISNTLSPTRDIQVLDLVFVHIKQVFGLTAVGAGCASAMPVKLQSTALQQKYKHHLQTLGRGTTPCGQVEF